MKYSIYLILLQFVFQVLASQDTRTETLNRLSWPPVPDREMPKPKPKNNMNCGLDYSNKARIVGGRAVQPGEFPWLALLEFETPDGIKLYCGGSLINRQYVVTAAHCVILTGFRSDWKVKSVRLGEYNTTSERDCSFDNEDCIDNMINVPVVDVIPHNAYNYRLKDQHNDIALLRLAHEVTFTNYISPICLSENEPLPNEFVVAGWGFTEANVTSEIPLKVKVPFRSIDSCNSYFKKVIPPYALARVIATQICAGGVEGKDSCTYDSGGPLMQKIATSHGISRWVLAGLVSYGSRYCGQKDYPSVYTNVYSFRQWILDNIKP